MTTPIDALDTLIDAAAKLGEAFRSGQIDRQQLDRGLANLKADARRLYHD